MSYIRSVCVDDATRWPNPYDSGAHEDSLEWVLRYGSPEQVLKVRMAAASVVAAYVALVDATDAKRRMVVRSLRRGGQ